MIIELYHPSDPRYLLVVDPPERISFDDLLAWRYGKALALCPSMADLVYTQPDGFGTDWVRPSRTKRGERRDRDRG